MPQCRGMPGQGSRCGCVGEKGEGWDREVFLSPHFSYSSDTIYREDETKARKQVCMCIDVTVKELLRP